MKRLANLYRFPLLDLGCEALALEHNGIDTDMYQHFNAAAGSDSQCMIGSVEECDYPCDRCEQQSRGGIE